MEGKLMRIGGRAVRPVVNPDTPPSHGSGKATDFVACLERDPKLHAEIRHSPPPPIAASGDPRTADFVHPHRTLSRKYQSLPKKKRRKLAFVPVRCVTLLSKPLIIKYASIRSFDSFRGSPSQKTCCATFVNFRWSEGFESGIRLPEQQGGTRVSASSLVMVVLRRPPRSRTRA